MARPHLLLLVVILAMCLDAEAQRSHGGRDGGGGTLVLVVGVGVAVLLGCSWLKQQLGRSRWGARLLAFFPSWEDIGELIKGMFALASIVVFLAGMVSCAYIFIKR